MAKDEDRVRDSERNEAADIAVPDPTRGRTPAIDESREAYEREAYEREAYERDAYEQVRHTRSGSLWFSLVAGAVVLLVLLAFIVQNQQNTQITLLFWEANLPLGVSLLIAAILGALTVGLAGAMRILQLRRAAKKLRS